MGEALSIGGVAIPAGAGLAPMAGITDSPYRRLCHGFGAAWSVTEMLSAKGYLYASKARATAELLRVTPEEGIVGLQLFGREPHFMAEAARRLSDAGFAFLDINMGCPAHKIVGNGEGSALMREPALAGSIIAATVRATRLPVTVKLRAGWDAEHINVETLARIAEDNGAAAIAVHPRTRDQQYAGQADWALIGRVVRAVHIPVIGNGDLRSGEDALRMLRETGCQAVMIGRAAQGNPWIFAEVCAALSGAPYSPPDLAARAEAALSHLDSEIAMRGELSAVLMMRKQLAQYVAGVRGRARLRTRIVAAETAAQVREILDDFARGAAN